MRHTHTDIGVGLHSWRLKAVLLGAPERTSGCPTQASASLGPSAAWSALAGFAGSLAWRTCRACFPTKVLLKL